MEKIKKIVKYDNIIMIIILCLIFIGSFYIKLSNSDEAWNFSTIYQMYKGYTIYKDLNAITTPLFFYLIEIVFKLSSANFFVFRICNIIINVCIYLIIYNIYKIILKNKTSSFLYTIITFIICNSTLYAMCSYNTLAVMFYFFGMYLNLKNKTNNNVFLQGVILFLIFMTKQNIGIYYILSLGLILLFYEKFKNEEIIIFLKIISIFIIMNLSYVIFLLYNNNFDNFINYCFLGIKDFNYNFNADFRLLLYLVIIVLSIVLTKVFKNYIDKKIIKLELYSLPLCLISYPIFNNVHMKLSLLGIVCVMISVSDMVIIKDFINKRIKRIVLYIIITTMSIFSLFYFIHWVKYVSNEKYINDSLYGAIIENDENINNIIKYIKSNDKKVIILSSYSKIYSVILNYNNGIFDLPFVGNLGKYGEEGLIKKISELKDTNILIEKDDEDIIYQESKKAREFIKNNYKNIGEIEQFYIYE